MSDRKSSSDTLDDELAQYFLDNHTQEDCAKKFGIHISTVRRRLRRLGVDSSIYNHSGLAKARCHHPVEFSEDELRKLYFDDNLSFKELSRHCKVADATMIKVLKRFGITKRKPDPDHKSVCDYFLAQHTIDDCRKHFGIGKKVVKRILRTNHIDTATYRHSELSKSRARQARYREPPADGIIIDLYKTQNMDTKSIAEGLNTTRSAVLKVIRRLGLTKTREEVYRSMCIRHFRRYGIPCPMQRPDVQKKVRRSSHRVGYTDLRGQKFIFRSLHEVSHAMLLDSKKLEWYYEDLIIPYVDSITGKTRLYTIDFTVIDGDKVEWIEVKPAWQMIPNDKRVCASRRADACGATYRGITDEERELGWELLKNNSSSLGVEFLRPKPQRHRVQITYWFKSKDDALNFSMEGWKRKQIIRHGPTLYALKLWKIDEYQDNTA